jgi:hypothetical protein
MEIPGVHIGEFRISTELLARLRNLLMPSRSLR